MFWKYFLAFVCGFLSCATLFIILFTDLTSIAGFVVKESSSPSNWLNESEILIYEDRIVLEISNATISSYKDTGSMTPIFDEYSNGIRVKPASPNQIRVGDIVTFRKSGQLLVHRVIKTGIDSEGVYFITKGDRNIFSDGKIRFEEIEYVTIGIIW